MNYNTDGFNERSIYIHNANDKNKLGNNNSNNNNSLVQMKINENKTDIKTVNNDKIFYSSEVKGNKDNFIVRNTNMNNSNPMAKNNNFKNNNMLNNNLNRFNRNMINK